MPSSSLVFVVVIAIWAAYLIQYWVKRRDHLATARSVDRFSAAMRVLDRRAVGATAPAPAPRSYQVHPARESRPQVVVKRASAAPAPSTGAHVVAQVAADHAGAHDVPRTHTAPAAGASRRVRGLAALTTFVLGVVLTPVAAFSALTWHAPALSFLGLTAAVVWLRRGVASERAAVAAERRARRAADRARFAAPVRATAAPAAVRTEHTQATREASITASTADAPYDVFAREAEIVAAEVAARPVAEQHEVAAPRRRTDDDDLPLTWDPVPVPRPTYTMKARAERVPAAPLPTATGGPRPVEVDADEDIVPVDTGRVVNG
ncbi:hypothetical protein [Janibacter sp. G56]|uniref:hypothetical protein n=1 Tax=Janibacter sp. G56 TaxID=3418717 RepID=UPI003D023685